MSAEPSRRLTHMEAIIDAIAGAMRADPRVFYIGQDVGAMGGSMQGTKGLVEEFGPTRIREAPISESAMVGAAIGAALFGQRPIVEVSFGEFLPAAMNQLINQAPNIHYMTGSTAHIPVVVRTRVGDGPYGGHPQDYSAWFAHVPGWKVVMPATPEDAKGMMAAAIRDQGPVLFFEAMSLSHAARTPVRSAAFETPIGEARTAREGRDVTVVAVGSSVPLALRAAGELAAEGIELEIVDLRTLRPLDRGAILASVRRTRRLITVHEAWVAGGIGAEVVACVAEEAPQLLLAPVIRIGTAPVPVPSGKVRPHALPAVRHVVEAARRVMTSTRG
jgi:pyruvate/2-oxoglutarate/acetoin dehydrogenase E1 component